MPGSVGAFPNMRDMMRRTTRAPVNPLDVSTLVSIYPKPLTFTNVTLLPGYWRIEAGSVENPAILHVGPSSWFKDAGLDEPLIEIVQGSIQIAEALIRDFCNGMYCSDMQESMIGLFFVPGRKEVADIHKEFKPLLAQALTRQTNYYKTLVKFGDSLWARSSGNPLVINEEMRLAARTLGLKDKDWMRDHKNADMVRCFACGEFKNPEYPICAHCRTIDPEHPKAKMVAKAETK